MMSRRKELTEKEKAYKPITENPIKIDLKEWKLYLDIFGLLKRKLGLPDFCGENWDAIWDLAWGFTSKPVTLEFYGVSAARERFPEDVKIMLEIFNDLHKKKCPHIGHVVIN
jgi:RNAse (barnase) inhibitor barstar